MLHDKNNTPAVSSASVEVQLRFPFLWNVPMYYWVTSA